MSKNNYIEPYVKENNLIQLSLFNFSRKQLKKTVVKWKDKNGSYSLKCVCDEGVPGSREQDCYTAAMRIWIKNDMPRGGIHLNYSDIARELRIKNIKHSSDKIKQSLKKLGGARYEFVQCFIEADEEGRRKVTTQFSLFDSTSLFEYRKGKSKKKSSSVLIFPEIIRKNLEKKYYQYLDMAWYRNLPEGLPRRLYEYLEKRRYHGVDGIFMISEEAICRWLPLNDKHVTNRRKRLKEISTPLIDKGFLSEYKFDANKKCCIFVYAKDAFPPKEEETDDLQNSQDTFDFDVNDFSEVEDQNKIAKQDQELCNLLSMINVSVSKKLEAVIKKYYEDNGFEYVKWNILYSNTHSKKRYSTYLQKALAENWGDEFQEEKENTEKENVKQQKELEEEQKKLERKEKQLKDLKLKFKEKVKGLDPAIKIKLMQKAEKCIPEDTLGRSMNVKIEYSKLVLSCINKESKKKFPDSTIAELGFIKEVFFL